MRLSSALIAFGLAVLLPCVPASFGADLPAGQYWALAAVGFSLGLFMVGLHDIATYNDRAEAESRRRERDANAEMTLAHAAEVWAKVNAPPPDIIDLGETENRAQRSRQFEVAHWRVYYRRIVAAGCAYGWDIRTLTDKKRETRVTTQPGWNVATDMLAQAGILEKDGTGTRMLVSETQWVAERMWEALPCPAGEPPEILPPPYTRQQTPQQTPAKQATIDT